MRRHLRGGDQWRIRDDCIAPLRDDSLPPRGDPSGDRRSVILLKIILFAGCDQPVPVVLFPGIVQVVPVPTHQDDRLVHPAAALSLEFTEEAPREHVGNENPGPARKPFQRSRKADYRYAPGAQVCQFHGMECDLAPGEVLRKERIIGPAPVLEFLRGEDGKVEGRVYDIIALDMEELILFCIHKADLVVNPSCPGKREEFVANGTENAGVLLRPVLAVREGPALEDGGVEHDAHISFHPRHEVAGPGAYRRNIVRQILQRDMLHRPDVHVKAVDAHEDHRQDGESYECDEEFRADGETGGLSREHDLNVLTISPLFKRGLTQGGYLTETPGPLSGAGRAYRVTRSGN